MEMTYWVTEGQFRMDLPEMSIIWASGDQQRMLMIQHAEKRYIEWDAQQLQMMQRMMGRMPGGGGSRSSGDQPMGDNISFEATGNSEAIGAWHAFEVQVRTDEGDQGQLWLTEDTDVGLFEVFASVVDMTSAMQLPMGMGGQQNNPQEMLQRYSALARAQGLPEGRAVRIVSTEGGGANVTLTAVQAGSPPAGTFDPPAGYRNFTALPFPGASAAPALPELPFQVLSARLRWRNASALRMARRSRALICRTILRIAPSHGFKPCANAVGTANAPRPRAVVG